MNNDAGDLLGTLSEEDASLISIRRVLVEIMREFGGPTGFAKCLKVDFNESPQGGTSRVQIETSMIRALQQFGAGEEDGSDDEAALECRAREIMAKLKEGNGRV